LKKIFDTQELSSEDIRVCFGCLTLLTEPIWKSSVLSHWEWLKGKPKRL